MTVPVRDATASQPLTETALNEMRGGLKELLGVLAEAGVALGKPMQDVEMVRNAAGVDPVFDLAIIGLKSLQSAGGALGAGRSDPSWTEACELARRADALLVQSATAESQTIESNEAFAKREAQNIINSSDAQCFRWLLKHHSGSGKALGGVGMRCWIGGVEFIGEDVSIAILDAIDREAGPTDRETSNG